MLYISFEKQFVNFFCNWIFLPLYTDSDFWILHSVLDFLLPYTELLFWKLIWCIIFRKLKIFFIFQKETKNKCPFKFGIMARPFVISQQKLGEKLTILKERGIGMLTRIYNIKKGRPVRFYFITAIEI